MPVMPSKWSENNPVKGILPAVKKPKTLMILGLIGIFLIFISSMLPSGEKKTENTASAAITAEEYRTELEKSVKELVKEITGDRNASVVITLDSGVRYSYADATETDVTSSSGNDNEQESSSVSRSYITVRTSDGGEQALLVTEYMPEVRGVAIVCSGGNNEQTAERIRGAVMAALDITSKRVYITGGNGK